MTKIEEAAKEFEKRKKEVEELEKALKEARGELKKFNKYRGLNFDLYGKYGNGKYWEGLARETFKNHLRSLVLSMAGVRVKKGCESHHYYLGFESKKVKELTAKEKKICNDLLDEIYPTIEKYINVFLAEREGKNA